MAKALYWVYFIFTLGFVAMGYSIFTTTQNLEQGTLACLRLPQTEMSKCVDSMSQQATQLGKVARALTGQN